jgi:hypothetical protein
MSSFDGCMYLVRRKEVYVTVENGLREQEIELEIPFGERLLYYVLRLGGMVLLARSTSNTGGRFSWHKVYH